ncbi:hypothetical protein CYMTET_23065, partial [Cymbomonas tetramitiformis]
PSGGQGAAGSEWLLTPVMRTDAQPSGGQGAAGSEWLLTPGAEERLRAVSQQLDDMVHNAWRICSESNAKWFCNDTKQLLAGDVASSYLPYIELPDAICAT